MCCHQRSEAVQPCIVLWCKRGVHFKRTQVCYVMSTVCNGMYGYAVLVLHQAGSDSADCRLLPFLGHHLRVFPLRHSATANVSECHHRHRKRLGQKQIRKLGCNRHGHDWQCCLSVLQKNSCIAHSKAPRQRQRLSCAKARGYAIHNTKQCSHHPLAL